MKHNWLLIWRHLKDVENISHTIRPKNTMDAVGCLDGAERAGLRVVGPYQTPLGEPAIGIRHPDGHKLGELIFEFRCDAAFAKQGLATRRREGGNRENA